EPVSDDLHAAPRARGRERGDRALERVEHVARATEVDLERLVVLVAAGFTAHGRHSTWPSRRSRAFWACFSATGRSLVSTALSRSLVASSIAAPRYITSLS